MSSRTWAGRKLHFIAIGGAGMSGLALVAHRLGAAVTGSDRAESGYLERLRAAGLDPAVGHDADLVPADAEVVVSTAIGADNPELARARERGQKELHRGQLLAELCAEGRLIAVAGTHGKTTTTGMIVHALRAIGADPTFFIGGELPGAGDDGGPANAGLGSGDLVVAEADESDASFLSLRPEVAVVTNVELDHHARWSSRASSFAPSRSSARPAPGVVRGADPALDSIAPPAPSRDVHRDRTRAKGPRAERSRSPQRPERPCRAGGDRARGRGRRCGRRRAVNVSRDASPPGAQGRARWRPRLRRLRAPSDRGARDAWPPCGSCARSA